MKVYISGVNAAINIEGKLKELGHEPLILNQSTNETNPESSSTSIINECEAVVCDMMVKRGIDDHRYASSIGKHVISVFPEEYRDRSLSPNIALMSMRVFYSSEDDLKMKLGEALNGCLKGKESEASVSKERR